MKIRIGFVSLVQEYGLGQINYLQCDHCLPRTLWAIFFYPYQSTQRTLYWQRNVYTGSFWRNYVSSNTNAIVFVHDTFDIDDRSGSPRPGGDDR